MQRHLRLSRRVQGQQLAVRLGHFHFDNLHRVSAHPVILHVFRFPADGLVFIGQVSQEIGDLRPHDTALPHIAVQMHRPRGVVPVRRGRHRGLLLFLLTPGMRGLGGRFGGAAGRGGGGASPNDWMIVVHVGDLTDGLPRRRDVVPVDHHVTLIRQRGRVRAGHAVHGHLDVRPRRFVRLLRQPEILHQAMVIHHVRAQVFVHVRRHGRVDVLHVETSPGRHARLVKQDLVGRVDLDDDSIRAGLAQSPGADVPTKLGFVLVAAFRQRHAHGLLLPIMRGAFQIDKPQGTNPPILLPHALVVHDPSEPIVQDLGRDVHVRGGLGIGLVQIHKLPIHHHGQIRHASVHVHVIRKREQLVLIPVGPDLRGLRIGQMRVHQQIGTQRVRLVFLSLHPSHRLSQHPIQPQVRARFVVGNVDFIIQDPQRRHPRLVLPFEPKRIIHLVGTKVIPGKEFLQPILLQPTDHFFHKRHPRGGFGHVGVLHGRGDILRRARIAPLHGSGIHAHQSLVGRSLVQIRLSMFRQRGGRMRRHGMRRHRMRDHIRWPG